jgi:hypothetical protein
LSIARNNSAANLVEYFADLVGWAGTGNPNIDWQEVEESLGLALPDDYKLFIARFPRGFIQNYIQICPPRLHDGRLDLLGTFRIVLDNMREMREDRPEDFPFPIYPEPGGLIIWGNAKRGEYFYWLPSSPNPNEWEIVVSGSGWEDLVKFPGPMIRFLTGLVEGHVSAPVLAKDLAEIEPCFTAWPGGA